MQYFLNIYLFGGGAYTLNLYYCETEEEALKVYEHTIKENLETFPERQKHLAHTFYRKLELVGVIGKNHTIVRNVEFEAVK